MEHRRVRVKEMDSEEAHDETRGSDKGTSELAVTIEKKPVSDTRR